MSACERCWSDAFILSRLHGGSQADWYRLVLAQRADDPTCAIQASRIDKEGANSGGEA